jgi:hypothetical protein
MLFLHLLDTAKAASGGPPCLGRAETVTFVLRRSHREMGMDSSSSSRSTRCGRQAEASLRIQAVMIGIPWSEIGQPAWMCVPSDYM